MEPKDLIHVTPYELWVRAEAWESKARSAEEEVAQLAARQESGSKSCEYLQSSVDILLKELDKKTAVIVTLVDQLAEASAQRDAYAYLARHDAELLAAPFSGIRGCGDHGCLIEKPEGMGTNGGCRCHLDRHKASIVMQRLAALRHQAEEE